MELIISWESAPLYMMHLPRWMCDFATSLQLPRGNGEGDGPKGTREGLRTRPLLSPNLQVLGK